MDRFHVTSWYKSSEFLKTFLVKIGQVFPQLLYAMVFLSNKGPQGRLVDGAYCRNGLRADSRSGQEKRLFEKKTSKTNFYAILGMGKMPKIESTTLKIAQKFIFDDFFSKRRS